MKSEQDRRQAGLFSTVDRGATLSEKVAASITQAILDGDLAPGERLLSERDLGEQFGVSRTVIREAVRSLVASGLIEARSGRGLQVAEASPDSVSRAMSMFLHRNATIDYPRVHEVRSALEIDMAGYAAERATAADVERLQELVSELGTAKQVERAAEVDVEFHRQVAEATHNELFMVLLDAIGEVLLAVRLSAFASEEMRRYAQEAHQEIVDGISAHDPERARAAMRKHLETAVDVWTEHGQGAPVPAP
jgi:GntR family transcriptional regulator, transcriptional repressor for pyruvate dehydrogenase complex